MAHLQVLESICTKFDVSTMNRLAKRACTNIQEIVKFSTIVGYRYRYLSFSFPPGRMKGEGDADDTADIFKNPEKLLISLQSSNKMDRKKGLENIYNQIKQISIKREPFEEKEVNIDGIEIDGYSKIFKSVMICISDSMEKCRELSFSILEELLLRISPELVVKFLPSLVPKLVERMGEQEIIEESEEIRLVAVNFILQLFNLLKRDLDPFVADLLSIMSNTLQDKFHEVIKSSCSITSLLAQNSNEAFSQNSEKLVPAIGRSIVHQQFRVRVAIIKCVGDVVQYGKNPKLIENLLPYLTQRLFDDLPTVRKEVIQVVGHWISHYIDRYSYFAKFLPFLMSGICDEHPQVTDIANELWNEAGKKFLEDNKEEYKDLIDLPTPQPEHYPNFVIRPELGCRLLASKNICKLLPGIINEISDWNESTRIKCAQLLYMLILHGEDKIIMHVENILQCMFKSCQDEEPIVVKHVLIAAELVGYFVPISITWPILSYSIRNSNSDAPYIISSLIINSSDSKLLEACVSSISETISDQDICLTLKTKRQESLVSICASLLELNPQSSCTRTVGYQIFYTLVSLYALRTSKEIAESAMSNLIKLQKLSGFETFEELVDLHCKKLFENMLKDQSDWTPTSPNKLIFEVIFTIGGSGIENNLDLVLKIMVVNLDPSKDSKVRLKFFTILGKILSENKIQIKDKELFQSFVKNIIEDILNPNLIWKPGHSADALRTAASSCLLSILRKEILEEKTVLDISPRLIPQLISLLEDQSDLTRLFVSKSLGLLPILSKKQLSPDLLHKIYPPLLKRMDDNNDNVRISACKSISAIFSNVPENYIQHYQVYMEHALDTLLIHLDDQEKEIQNAVYETLKKIGPIHRGYLIDACEKVKYKHRTSDLCDALVNDLKLN